MSRNSSSRHTVRPLAPSNGIQPAGNLILAAARENLQRGWFPIPVPAGEKGPRLPEWQNLRLTEADLPRHFGNGGNVGLLLGSVSHDLVDVDLDVAEAVALADLFLPPTDRRSGRPSKPRSHRWYISSVSKPLQYRDTKDKSADMLLELRADGQQTLIAPSVHPDSGESLVGESAGDPATVDPTALTRAVGKLAAATLLVRHWPAPNTCRHDVALALAGWLLRHKWTQETTEHFIRAVAEAAQDEEVRDRVRTVASTVEKLAADKKFTGLPELAKLLGSEVAGKLQTWLGLKSTVPPKPVSTTDLPCADYQRTVAGLIWHKPTKDGPMPVRLTNFAATITAEIFESDGVETRLTFEIAAHLHGRTVHFTVPAERFAALGWVTEHLGASAIVFPGNGTRDHTRVAIQTLSGRIPPANDIHALGVETAG